MRKLDSEMLRKAAVRLMMEAACNTTPRGSAAAFGEVASWLLEQANETDLRAGAVVTLRSGDAVAIEPRAVYEVTAGERPAMRKVANADAVYRVARSELNVVTVVAASEGAAVERAKRVAGMETEPTAVVRVAP